jgi:hypothetical protein
VLALGDREHAGFGAWVGSWALHRLLWAVPAALVIGYALSRYLGAAAIRRRSMDRHAPSTSDFLALALIALAYATAHPTAREALADARLIEQFVDAQWRLD